MNQTEIDLMNVRHSIQLGQAYHDPDGLDWRLTPHDDTTVVAALQPDPPPAAAAGADPCVPA